MGRRGPRSTAELSLPVPAVSVPVPRVKPPRALTKAEHRHWTATVDALPAFFFGPEHAQQLAQYVQHAALAEQFGAWLAKSAPDTPEWVRINAAMLGHSKAALAYARALRITVNSRADRDAAAAAARDGRAGPATVAQLRQRYAQGG